MVKLVQTEISIQNSSDDDEDEAEESNIEHSKITQAVSNLTNDYLAKKKQNSARFFLRSVFFSIRNFTDFPKFSTAKVMF